MSVRAAMSEESVLDLRRFESGARDPAAVAARSEYLSRWRKDKRMKAKKAKAASSAIENVLA